MKTEKTMQVKEIMKTLNLCVANDRIKTLPFIVNDRGGKIAVLTYFGKKTDKGNIINFFDGLFIINPKRPKKIKEYRVKKEFDQLPIDVSPQNEISSDESYREALEKYYFCIDNFFETGKIDLEEYKRLFLRFYSEKLIPILIELGFEFLD